MYRLPPKPILSPPIDLVTSSARLSEPLQNEAAPARHHGEKSKGGNSFGVVRRLGTQREDIWKGLQTLFSL